jgi:hypothetical protein
MSGSPIPTEIDPGSQSARRLRVAQVRGLNPLDRRIDIDSQYSAVDMDVSANSTWSASINVQGFDSMDLFAIFIAGNIDVANGGGFELSIQSAMDPAGPWFDQVFSFDTHWHTQTGGAGTVPLVGADPSLSFLGPWTALDGAANGDRNFAVTTRCAGNYMRFRPGGDDGGADFDDSRFTLFGIRRMEGS